MVVFVDICSKVPVVLGFSLNTGSLPAISVTKVRIITSRICNILTSFDPCKQGLYFISNPEEKKR